MESMHCIFSVLNQKWIQNTIKTSSPFTSCVQISSKNIMTKTMILFHHFEISFYTIFSFMISVYPKTIYSKKIIVLYHDIMKYINLYKTISFTKGRCFNDINVYYAQTKIVSDFKHVFNYKASILFHPLYSLP